MIKKELYVHKKTKRIAKLLSFSNEYAMLEVTHIYGDMVEQKEKFCGIEFFKKNYVRMWSSEFFEMRNEEMEQDMDIAIKREISSHKNKYLAYANAQN